MSETTDVTTTVTEPTSEDNNILSFINEDGTFKEGWRNFVPEDIRTEKVFDRAVSMEGVFKSLASAERMIGKGIPTKNSTEDDWNEHYKKLGSLDKPEKYKFGKDPEIEDEYWPEGIVGVMQKASHEARVNEKQAGIFNKAFNEFLKGQITKTRTEEQLKYDEELKGLKEEWSGTYDANIHLGNIALEKGIDGNSELKERVKEKFGPDPDFARIMKNLGHHFTEGKVLKIDTAVPVTVADVDSQIKELMSSDAFNNRMNPGHKAALEKQRQLLSLKSKIK